MPLRARIKKVFSTHSPSSSSSSAKSNPNSLTHTTSRGIGDPSIYQPGETMPRPKYRGAVDKKHKKALESFSFGDTWRRKSTSSQGSGYSPMASRSGSIGGPDGGVELGTGTGGGKTGWWTRRKSGVTGLRVAEDADEEEDMANVGGTSKRHSNAGNGTLATGALPRHDEDDSGASTKPHGTAHDHTPFTENDINLALTRSETKSYAPPTTSFD